MKTIRGKIISFSIVCLAFVGLLTALYYENTVSLRRKIYNIERFDDLLNDVLELRRYEKNFILYRDNSSLKEGKVYLSKIDNDFNVLRDDVTRIIGKDACLKFSRDLAYYKQILDDIISADEPNNGRIRMDTIRTKGKTLVDGAQTLIRTKRRQIDETLKRALTLPLASMGSLVVLIVVMFQFVNRGILKPLSLIRKATEKVAKDAFTPIRYDKDKQDEITRLMASFNRMVDELESRQDQLVQSRKLASIGTLISGIAHELNNPLNNISITAETLMMNYHDMSEKEMEEITGDILTEADRASQVVKNLLEFSRKECPYFKNVDIRNVLERAFKLIKNQLMVAHIQIEKDIAGDLPFIRGKKQDLQQVFVNILLNAIHAMPEGGGIKILAGQGPEGYIKIDFSDTGTGIKPEALSHIFDPFYTTKEVGKGTGLGLSLVYSIIRTHGGYIEVKSEVDEGTIFSIYLPENKGKEDSEDEIQGSDS